MSNLHYVFYGKHPVPIMFLWSVLVTAAWALLAFFLTRFRKPEDNDLTKQTHYQIRGKLWSWLNRFLFVCITVFIYCYTVVNRTQKGHDVSLVPFITLVNAKTKPELYRSFVANILLFVPFGLSMPFTLDSFRPRYPILASHPVIKTILSAVFFSALIEAIQFKLSIGVCETDDVIANSFGAAVGCLAFPAVSLLSRLLSSITEFIRRKRKKDGSENDPQQGKS